MHLEHPAAIALWRLALDAQRLDRHNILGLAVLVVLVVVEVATWVLRRDLSRREHEPALLPIPDKVPLLLEPANVHRITGHRRRRPVSQWRRRGVGDHVGGAVGHLQARPRDFGVGDLQADSRLATYPLHTQRDRARAHMYSRRHTRSSSGSGGGVGGAPQQRTLAGMVTHLDRDDQEVLTRLDEARPGTVDVHLHDGRVGRW